MIKIFIFTIMLFTMLRLSDGAEEQRSTRLLNDYQITDLKVGSLNATAMSTQWLHMAVSFDLIMFTILEQRTTNLMPILAES